MEQLAITGDQISIDSNRILSLLGNQGGEVDHHASELIEHYAAECKEIVSPRGGYARFDSSSIDSKSSIDIGGALLHIGKIIKTLLKGSRQYVFFAVTAGPEPEALSRSLMDNNQFLEGYIVDLIGSGIAETAADIIHQHIRKEVESEGMKVTNRYSPGYCSWDVAEQQKLFGLIPEGHFGITLSASSLMSPIKSVSGIIGIGPSVGYQEYTCEICSMKTCIFRNTGI